ncbi:SUMF1/EgtB/PvdO family nonheme iron enzyme [Candidatus Latescibacterota bacterium]
MKPRYIISIIFILSVVFCLMNCEAPTKPERDDPLDKDGINYQVPDTPTVTDPGESVGFGVSYTIKWSDAERATLYIIEESSDSLFVPAIADTVTVVTDVFHHYVNKPTTKYYRVKGMNGEYEGSWSNKVDIEINPLDVPQITEQTETIISGNEFSLTWAAVDSTQTYILEESPDNTFNNPEEITTSSASYQTIHTTESPTSYFYRVKAQHSEFSSGWSDVVEIRINPPVPVSPVLESPVVHWNSVKLTWDVVNHATSYTIEEADNRNFTHSVNYDSSNAISKIIYFDVDSETTMYYRIKANGISGSSDWSDTVECIHAPFVLDLSVTANEVFSEKDYTLSWNSVDAASYTVEESTNKSFTSSTEHTVSGTIKSFNSLLEKQQTLYYRVQALDGTIKSDWSNTVEVVITPPIPDSPLLSAPVVDGSTVTVSWNDISYASSFTLEASQDSTFSSVERIDLDTTSYGFSYSIEETTTYYYRVKAIGVSGSSVWSNIAMVTVEPISHELTIAVSPAGSGTTNPTPGNYTHNESTVVAISAIPNEGYRFVTWTGEVANVNSDTTSVKLTSDMTVTANFEIIPDPITEITMVSIPAGSFQMGDIQGGGDSHERPVHAVTLSGYEMSATEITQRQYQYVVGTNPATEFYGAGDTYPVYDISWYDAVKFCNALSDAAGLARCYDESTWECDFSLNGYRLPTEAEWEYACRASTDTRYYTGNSESDLARAGWYKSNSDGKTHPVAQKTPNSWGLYDMHGNVWEWCNDKYGNGSYSLSHTTNPTGPTFGSPMVRGGSWSHDSSVCRSAWRNRYGLQVGNADFGFRVARGSFTPGYTISGTIIGADDVTFTMTGDASDTQTVNDGGTYSFTVEHDGSYTVTPSKEGYTFSPTGQTFSDVSANQTQNFVAELNEVAYFTIGSTKDEVRTAQGETKSVKVFYSSTMWEYGDYGLTYIEFSNDTNTVTGYDNFDNILNVFMGAKIEGAKFKIGSTKDEVLAAQGTPKGVKVFYSSTMWEYGDYGLTYIEFSNDTNTVTGYDNFDNILNIGQ